jgi:hypothetical protein
VATTALQVLRSVGVRRASRRGGDRGATRAAGDRHEQPPLDRRCRGGQTDPPGVLVHARTPAVCQRRPHSSESAAHDLPREPAAKATGVRGGGLRRRRADATVNNCESSLGASRTGLLPSRARPCCTNHTTEGSVLQSRSRVSSWDSIAV